MNLTTKNISIRSKDYKKINAIYKEAFPKDERIPLPLVCLMSKKKTNEALAYYDNDELVGMTYIIGSDETLFLFYIAVNNQLRSKGYGSEILKRVTERSQGKPVSLFIETMDDLDASNYEQRERRLTYYERNGFKRTNLQAGFKGPELDILSNTDDFTLEQGKTLVKGTPLKIFIKEPHAEVEKPA